MFCFFFSLNTSDVITLAIIHSNAFFRQNIHFCWTDLPLDVENGIRDMAIHHLRRKKKQVITTKRFTNIYY